MAWGVEGPGRHGDMEIWSHLREAGGASHAGEESGNCGRSAKRLQKRLMCRLTKDCIEGVVRNSAEL